ALRRHAPARDDRGSADLRPAAADRRRADHRTRRHRAGTDPGVVARAQHQVEDRVDADHTRSRRRRRDLYADDHDVCGRSERGCAGRRRLVEAAASLPLWPAALAAAPEPASCRPAVDPGPGAVARREARGLPLPAALRPRRDRLRDRTDVAGRRRRSQGALLALPRARLAWHGRSRQEPAKGRGGAAMTGVALSQVADNDDIIVSVRDLEVQFQTQDRRGTLRAIDGVSFDVRRGETFGIIGESGSGKTTVGRALVLLQKPTAGSIKHNGLNPQELPAREFRRHRRDYQIIFQDPNAALNPRMTILSSVLEPLELAGEGSADQRRQRALQALDRVGLSAEIGTRYPHQLSGGQKQRVLIARALTLHPKLIVCDE